MPRSATSLTPAPEVSPPVTPKNEHQDTLDSSPPTPSDDESDFSPPTKKARKALPKTPKTPKTPRKTPSPTKGKAGGGKVKAESTGSSEESSVSVSGPGSGSGSGSEADRRVAMTDFLITFALSSVPRDDLCNQFAFTKKQIDNALSKGRGGNLRDKLLKAARGDKA